MKNKLWPAWILVLIIYGLQENDNLKEELAAPTEATPITTFSKEKLESNAHNAYSEQNDTTPEEAHPLAIKKMKIDYRTHHQKLKLSYQVQNSEIKAKIQRKHGKSKGETAQNEIESLFQSTDFSTVTADSLLKTLQNAYDLSDYTDYQI